MAFIEDRWLRRDRTRTDRYGKGLRWRVEWSDREGRKRRQSFEHKRLAENFLIEIRHEQKRGVYRAPVTDATLAEVYQKWVDAHPNAPTNTTASRVSSIKLFKALHGRVVDRLDREDIQNAVNALLLDKKPNTIRGASSRLGAALNWALEEGIISNNPYQRIRLPKAPSSDVEPMTSEDVRSLSEAMTDPAGKAMVLIGATTGLRISELRAITWDRVKGDQLRVDRQLDKKGEVFTGLKNTPSDRKVRLGRNTLQVMHELRKEIGAGAHQLVFHRGGSGLGYGQVWYMWTSAREAAGMDYSGWHQLRHYHASQLIHAGFSPVAVAHRLGHTDANTTLRVYAHFWPSDDAEMATLSDKTITPRIPPERRHLRAIPG